MNIQSVKKFFEDINYPCNVEFVDDEWCLSPHGECYFNDRKDIYSFTKSGGYLDKYGFRIQNGDNGCGDTITYFLPLDKEISYDEFEEKYEDQM